MARAIVSICSDLACNGGQKQAVVSRLMKGSTVEWSRTGTSRAQIVMPWNDPAAAYALDDFVIRIDRDNGTTSEWRIAERDDVDGPDDAVIKLTADPPLHDLGRRGLVRAVTGDDLRTQFAGENLATTLAVLWSALIAPGLSADGLGAWSLGTNEATRLITAYDFTNVTYLEAIRWLAEATEMDLVARRIGETGYVIDFVQQEGGTADRPRLQTGRNVQQVRRNRSTSERATEVIVLTPHRESATYAVSLGYATFRVTSVVGDVVTIEDPDAPTRLPLVLDDQCTGLVVANAQGTLVDIASVDASTQALTLEPGGGANFREGGLLTFRLPSGVRPYSLRRPPVVGSMPRIVRRVVVADVNSNRNITADPLLDDGVTGWSVIDKPSGTDADYVWATPRAEGTLSGSLSAGVTVGDATAAVVVGANQWLRRLDILQTAAFDLTTDGAVVADGLGVATVDLTAALPSALHLDTPIAVIGVPGSPSLQFNASAGATQLIIQGFAPGESIPDGTTVRILPQRLIVGAPVQANGAGAATVTLWTAATASSLTGTTLSVPRPTFGEPSLAGTNAVRLGTGYDISTPANTPARIVTPFVPVGASSVYVRALAGVTMRNHDLNGTQWGLNPAYISLELVATASGSARGLTVASSPSTPAAGASVDFLASTGAGLFSSGESAAARLRGGAFSTSSDLMARTGVWVRYVGLFASFANSTEVPPAFLLGGGPNVLWHRATAELLDRSREQSTLSITMRDRDFESERLALGAVADVVSERLGINEPVRLVGITFDLLDPEQVRVVVDRPRPRLIDTL